MRLQNQIVGLVPDHARELLKGFNEVSTNVECPHNASHLLTIATEILRLPDTVPGVIVEAGCFKGGSTAKLSLVAELVDRELVVFDSFEGLPPNDEPHDQTIDGVSIAGWFDSGQFHGTRHEVEDNVTRYGRISRVTLVEGWFEDTMPGFDDEIAVAYLDVDLAESTKTCLRYLYPKITPGGVLVSQDGDFPLVVEVFADDRFWEEEVGTARPTIEGLGVDKMLVIRK